MGGEDTDSQMMRRQQALDAAESLPVDETRGQPGASDSDPASAAARQAAKDGQGASGEWAEDAVLRQNRAALSKAGPGGHEAPRGEAAQDGSLASSGRSLLKD